MSAQPEAPRIATRAERMFKVLEGNETVPTMRVMEFMQEAAVELRRLHAENDTLREDLRKFREAASCERDLRQEQERHATALVRQMLEALWPWDVEDANHTEQYAAITAAREWLAPKNNTIKENS